MECIRCSLFPFVSILAVNANVWSWDSCESSHVNSRVVSHEYCTAYWCTLELHSSSEMRTLLILESVCFVQARVIQKECNYDRRYDVYEADVESEC